MFLLKALGQGDKFRPAHPRQLSLNNRLMSRGSLYRVERIFPQSPHLYISVDVSNPLDKLKYSLRPMTPVLLGREPLPTEDEVLQFLSPAARRKVVLGYRLLWDGKTPLGNVITPQATLLLEFLYAFGKREYGSTEIKLLLKERFEAFVGRGTRSGTKLLSQYAKYLASAGLLEELVADGAVPSSIREANLQWTTN
jgi:hypothetical protein